MQIDIWKDVALKLRYELAQLGIQCSVGRSLQGIACMYGVTWQELRQDSETRLVRDPVSALQGRLAYWFSLEEEVGRRVAEVVVAALPSHSTGVVAVREHPLSVLSPLLAEQVPAGFVLVRMDLNQPLAYTLKLGGAWFVTKFVVTRDLLQRLLALVGRLRGQHGKLGQLYFTAIFDDTAQVEAVTFRQPPELPLTLMRHWRAGNGVLLVPMVAALDESVIQAVMRRAESPVYLLRGGEGGAVSDVERLKQVVRAGIHGMVLVDAEPVAEIAQVVTQCIRLGVRVTWLVTGDYDSWANQVVAPERLSFDWVASVTADGQHLRFRSPSQ